MVIGISSYKVSHVIYVCEGLNEPVLLGREFLRQSGAVINLRHGIVTFNEILELPLENAIDKSSIARISESVCVLPEAEVLCQITCHKSFNNKTIELLPLEENQFCRFAVANSVNVIKK